MARWFTVLCLTLPFVVATSALAEEDPPVSEAAATGYWKFDTVNPVPGNHNNPEMGYAVPDSSGNYNPMYTYASAEYSFQSDVDVPPPTLYSGENVASFRPDPGGVSFHEVAVSGNIYNFSEQNFTLEGYFKTLNASDPSRLFFNAQGQPSYWVGINDAGMGKLTFSANLITPEPLAEKGSTKEEPQTVNLDLSGNYADDRWYYFVARYEVGAGATGGDTMRFSTYGDNGLLVESADIDTPVGMVVIPTSTNLGIGNGIHELRFDGLVDELRVTRGLLPENRQLNNVRFSADEFAPFGLQDYTTAGVAGTDWDGILYGDNAESIVAENGQLTVSIADTVAAGWDSNYNNAPYLYQTVADGEDFDVQVTVAATTDTSYSVASLMVRSPEVPANGGPNRGNIEDVVMLNHNNFSSKSTTFRGLDDGAVSNAPLAGQDQYLRIVREGEDFTFFTRALDDREWTLRYTETRPDLAGEVQVGLWYGLFGGGNAGEGVFENFSLAVYENGGSLPQLAGDLNGDGFVNSADLDLVRGAWGQAVSAGDWASGDPSGDGMVGSADLDIVRGNWGKTAAATVPEPSCVILLAGLVLLVARRRIVR